MLLGWALIQYNWCPYRKRLGHRQQRGTIMWGHGKKVPSASQGERSQKKKTNLPPELWKNKFIV